CLSHREDKEIAKHNPCDMMQHADGKRSKLNDLQYQDGMLSASQCASSAAQRHRQPRQQSTEHKRNNERNDDVSWAHNDAKRERRLLTLSFKHSVGCSSFPKTSGTCSHSPLGHHDLLAEFLLQAFACAVVQSCFVVEEVFDTASLQGWASTLVDGL